MDALVKQPKRRLRAPKPDSSRLSLVDKQKRELARARKEDLKTFARLAEAIAENAGDEMRAAFNDPDFIEQLPRIVKARALAGDFKFADLSARITGLVKERSEIKHEFLVKFHVKTEEELLMRSQEWERANASVGDIDSIIVALTVNLLKLVEQREERREYVIRTLGGLVPVPDAERV